MIMDVLRVPSTFYWKILIKWCGIIWCARFALALWPSCWYIYCVFKVRKTISYFHLARKTISFFHMARKSMSCFHMVRKTISYFHMVRKTISCFHMVRKTIWCIHIDSRDVVITLNFENFQLMLKIHILGIACEIAVRWMPRGVTDDKSTLVQVMAWC